MIIAGLQKTTLLDFPGEVASTVFTYGCNLRCPYCHNPELVTEAKNIQKIELDELFKFLHKRKNVLGGVCITGGEPLLYDDLGVVIDKIKQIGLKVKVDTNGSLPEKLKKIHPDYIAMDIKTSLEKYSLLNYTGKGDLSKKLTDSITYIIKSGIPHEFRTTVAPGIIDIDDIKKIIPLIKGADKYYLAQFRPKNTLDPEWAEREPYDDQVLEDMKQIIIEAGIDCEIRTGYKIT